VLIPFSPNAVNNSPAALAIGTPLANPLSPGLMLTGTQVGIGTNQYAAAIEIHNSYSVGMNIFVHSDTYYRAPITTYYRSRGTQLSPAAVTNADILAYPNQIYGHDGTGYFGSPTLEFRATENWNSTSHGAATDFFSVVNGTTSQFRSMTIDNTGFVGINAGITPGARLSVGIGGGSYPNGAFQVNDFGQATLLTIQYLAAASAPTSAGTAGTAGQIIYYSGLLYFCSVTGGVGSATWNKLSMTAV
jgi:hypothetical protein